MAGSTTYLAFATNQDALVTAGMDSVIIRVLPAVWPIFHWLAVIYIIITFAQVTANVMTMNVFLGRAVRLFAVVFLIHSAGSYQQYVRTLAFVDVPNEIASIVSGAPADVSAAAQFDKVTQNVDYLLADALAKNTGSWAAEIGNVVAIHAVQIVADLFVAIMFFIWMLGRTLLAIVLCYGPFILLFELFERTRGFVEAWAGKIVGLLVYQLATAVVLQILIVGLTTQLQNAKAASGIGIDEMISNLVRIASFLGGDILVLIALPSICAIGSGAAAGHAVASGFGMAGATVAGRNLGQSMAHSIRGAGSAAAASIRRAVARA